MIWGIAAKRSRRWPPACVRVWVFPGAKTYTAATRIQGWTAGLVVRRLLHRHAGGGGVAPIRPARRRCAPTYHRMCALRRLIRPPLPTPSYTPSKPSNPTRARREGRPIRRPTYARPYRRPDPARQTLRGRTPTARTGGWHPRMTNTPTPHPTHPMPVPGGHVAGWGLWMTRPDSPCSIADAPGRVPEARVAEEHGGGVVRETGARTTGTVFLYSDLDEATDDAARRAGRSTPRAEDRVTRGSGRPRHPPTSQTPARAGSCRGGRGADGAGGSTSCEGVAAAPKA